MICYIVTLDSWKTQMFYRLWSVLLYVSLLLRRNIDYSSSQVLRRNLDYHSSQELRRNLNYSSGQKEVLSIVLVKSWEEILIIDLVKGWEEIFILGLVKSKEEQVKHIGRCRCWHSLRPKYGLLFLWFLSAWSRYPHHSHDH